MAESKKSHQLFQDSWYQYEENNGKCTPSSTTVSNGSSSDNTTDDTSSSESSSFSANSNPFGALYDMSEIMTQLPIKRGLSKYYRGKSESFASLSRATSIEDLAKKANAYRKNTKAYKSIGTGLHSYKSYTLPKPIIAKKSKRDFLFFN